MTDLTNIPGLYGKIPVLGDFVTRRLTTRFIEVWDKWLQSALAASREQLGREWLDIYLTSPIWHFILSPGICGTNAWAGIMMPSVDKVGRYFPLTFAASINPSQGLPEIFMGATAWFEQLEQLALSALEDDLNLTELDRKLQAQMLPETSALNVQLNEYYDYSIRAGKLAFHNSMDQLEHLNNAFVQLGFCLLADLQPTYSLWSTTGSETMRPCLRVYSNLPPRDAFSELLVGREEKVAVHVQTASAPPRTERDCSISADMSQTGGIVANPRLHWRSFAGTTVGKRRKINEDAYLERPEIGLWVVADGMGGHSAGDVASTAAVDALGTLCPSGNLESYSAYASECLRMVNADLLKMAGRLGAGQIMGTTVVVMLAVAERCAAIWAGDSRLYQLQDGMLTQLTRDHSLATELSQQGIYPSSQAGADNAQNIVTRALGAGPDLALDVVNFEAHAGDVYLLCSDGLDKEVGNREIADILGQGDCRVSVPKLLDMALERGARDNVTVVVVHAVQTGLRE